MLGEHDLTKADGEKKVRVCSTTLHPRYNRKRIDNDFAILRLCSPVSFSSSVSTVCLPSSNNYDNVQAIASGWGTLSSGGSSPNILMKVSLNTMSNRECKNKYWFHHVTANMICAARAGKSGCKGDSGGPLVTRENNGFSLIGVVSHGKKCEKVSIFTKKNIVVDIYYILNTY